RLESTACLAEGTLKANADNSKLLTPTSFIAVPARHDAAKTRWLQARKLHITSDGRTYWNYEVSGEPIPVSGVPSVSELACVEDRFWQRIYDRVCKTDENHICDPKKERDEKSDMAAIQQLVLSSIRNKVHADIALLQEKDFYPNGLKDYLAEHCQQPGDTSTGCSLKCGSKDESRLDIQQILERIVWKGDFIQSPSVTGGVLKTILKKSDQFAETEDAGYIPVDEKGRQLVKLGIRPDPNSTGEYLINGKPLDPNALYTVAISDFIALGDTGYPELATPPVGDPDPPASPRGEVSTVSAVTCREIKSQASNPSDFCNEDIPAKDFPDRAANRKPDDARAVNTNVHKFYAWTFLRRHLGQPTGHLPAATRVEAVQAAMQKRVEDDTNWNWSFDKLSIGFSGVAHTGSEQTVSQEFGGVLSPVVTVPHSHSWDWDANSKLTLYHPKADWFVSDILQYSSRFTSQASGPRNETQIRNQFVFEGGSYFHLHPWRGKELPQLSLALYGHFETLVGSPITMLQIAGSAFPLVFDQGRTFLLLGRSGLRWENRKSYVEAGLEGGQTLNAIRQFDVLVAPSGPTVPCQLEALVSLTTCINNFNQANPATPVTNTSTVNVQRSPQDRYGAYWAMRVTVPINDTISYNFQDLGDYFFLSSGDNSADTRFRHQLTHTLKFMVFPNLSFEPTYTMYFYENKVDYNFLFQQQYSIKINYSFNLSNWNERKRQFKYKKPAS
ncbi:MAG TPA: 5'-nucleotidase C-terminal domain-containing protein, partial [Candidatus Angelobacter sp.]